MTWNERLDEWRIERGWTPKHLATISGVDYNSVLKYLAGKVDKPRGDTIEKLAGAFDRTEIELLYGGSVSGDIPENNNLSGSADKITARHTKPTVYTLAGIAKMAMAELPERPTSREDFVLSVSSVGPRAFALTVEDESMGDEYPPGTLIICDPDEKYKPGDLVIAIIRSTGTAVFKKYRPLKIGKDGIELFELVPLNTDYMPITCDAATQCDIIAKVVKRLESV